VGIKQEADTNTEIKVWYSGFWCCDVVGYQHL